MDILLPITILIPLAGIGVIWASAEGGHQPARLVALATSLGTLLAAMLLIANYPADGGDGFGGNYFGTGDSVLKRWWGSNETDASTMPRVYHP